MRAEIIGVVSITFFFYFVQGIFFREHIVIDPKIAFEVFGSIVEVVCAKGVEVSCELIAFIGVIPTHPFCYDVTGIVFQDKIVERSAKSGKSSPSLVRKKIATQSFPADGLQTFFESKPPANICFCLAILDTGNSIRSLQADIADFNSNIAKYSIVALKREIVGMGFGFKIIELSKT